MKNRLLPCTHPCRRDGPDTVPFMNLHESWSYRVHDKSSLYSPHRFNAIAWWHCAAQRCDRNESNGLTTIQRHVKLNAKLLHLSVYKHLLRYVASASLRRHRPNAEQRRPRPCDRQAVCTPKTSRRTQRHTPRATAGVGSKVWRMSGDMTPKRRDVIGVHRPISRVSEASPLWRVSLCRRCRCTW